MALLMMGAMVLFDPSNPGKSHASNSFALVELFTSEGCSTCPPADELLARIRKEYKSNVYVLGFHVDYWNSLGWKDQFSDPSYSKRQQEYAGVFHLSSIYTPQIIVNGKSQFVGSDEHQLRKTLDEELKSSSGSPLVLSANVSAKKEVQVHYHIDSLHEQFLHVALIQFHASTQVKKGENQGKQLQHVNLVRDFKSLIIDRGKPSRGTVVFSIPSELSTSDCGIIGYLQEKQTLQVRAAVQIPLQ